MVSGGAGFIGSHLSGALLDAGMSVLALDNLLTGSPDNVRELQMRPDFEFRQANVNDQVIVEGDVRYVLHFASPASPPQYDANPIHTLKVGTLGTMNMLGLARAKDATFLLASTSEVYGDPLVHPQPETYWGNVNPIGPRGCYDEAKRCAEAFAMAYHKAHGVDTRIIRIFNTHGPRMQVLDGRAVPNFMAQAIRGEPLTVYGDGSQTRSLCYVSDLVRGVLAALERGDEAAGQSRQSRRGDCPRARSNYRAACRLQKHHRVPRAACRRSEAAAPGHHPRSKSPGLGAARGSRRRSRPNPGILPGGRMTTPERLKQYVRNVPGYPQAGIIFRDITPLLAHKELFREIVDLMSNSWSDRPPDLVAAIEARGFIPGAAIAVKLNAGFVPIRKTGKLPWKTISESYQLEYGADQLEVHADAVEAGQRVLIVDDVLATGGTAAAAVRLMRKLGGDVICVQVLIELEDLGGRKRLPDMKVVSEIVY